MSEEINQCIPEGKWDYQNNVCIKRKSKPKENKSQLFKLGIAGLTISIGLILFKFIPMAIWGENIVFDASAHISIAIFVLYVLWFFIDQNESWRIIFFIFAFMVLTIISLHRLIVQAHNDIGLLAGLVIGLVAIGASESNYIKGKLQW